MKRILPFLALAPVLASAQGASTEASAARLALTDVLVKELKGARQARFAVRWDYLPESPALRERTGGAFTLDGRGRLVPGHVYTLPNATLRDPRGLEAWFAAQKDRRTLALALSGGRLGDAATLDAALGAGVDFWRTGFLKGLGLTGDGPSTVPWPDYIGAKRDFFAMRALLKETKGAAATLDFSPAPRGENPSLVANGLTWRIRVLPLPSTAPTPLYRFVVSVESSTIVKTFRGSADSPASANPQMAVQVGLLKEADRTAEGRPTYRFARLSIAADLTTVDATALPGAEGVTPLTPKLSPSVGATTLEVLTGTTAGGLLAPLIANDSESRLFSGGLVGDGVVSPVLGLNYLLTERTDGNLGFLYGFTTSGDGLFLGPSLSLGPFVAGVGARVFNKADDSVTAKLAGTLSIDLNRVFGKSTVPLALHPKLVQPGSEIWMDSDALYAGVQAFLGRVTVAPGSEPGGPVMLVQVRDATGAPLADGPRFALRVGGVSLLVLPRGGFDVIPPAGYEIGTLAMRSEEPPPPADVADVANYEDRQTLSTVALTPQEDRAQAVEYVLRKKAGDAPAPSRP